MTMAASVTTAVVSVKREGPGTIQHDGCCRTLPGPSLLAGRLFRDRSAAIGLTAMFGLFVMALKNQSSPTPIPMGMFSGLLAFRVATGLFSIYCYMRGGAFLVWWWVLLLESRHLPGLFALK